MPRLATLSPPVRRPGRAKAAAATAGVFARRSPAPVPSPGPAAHPVPDLARAVRLGHRHAGLLPFRPLSAPAERRAQRDDEVDDTSLRVQQGPSCWLTVIESMLRYAGKDTSTLKVILGTYESSAEIDQWKKDNPGKVKDMKGYTAPITKNLENAGQVLDKLKNALIPAQRAGRDVKAEKISKSRLSDLLNRVSPYMAGAVNELTFDINDDVTIRSVAKVFVKVKNRLTILLKAMGNQAWDKQVTSLFDLGEMSIDAKTTWSDFLLTMRYGAQLPTWIGITEGIKGDDLPKADTDFRGLTPKFNSNNHAIMMIAYGEDETGKYVKYKNPNRGDYVYTVSFAQFLKMAGSKTINIFSFKRGFGGVKSLTD